MDADLQKLLDDLNTEKEKPTFETAWSQDKPTPQLFFDWAKTGKHQKIKDLDPNLSRVYVHLREDSDQQTPLHHACDSAESNFETIQTLIDLGADPHSKDDRLRTPLLLAAKLARPEVLKYLIVECKCDPNAANDWKETPFQFWLSSENIPIESCEEMFDIWVAAKADPQFLSKSYGNSVNNLVSHVICSVGFDDKKTKVEKYNKNSIETAIILLPKLLGMNPKPDVDAIGRINTEGTSAALFGNLYSNESTPLGNIVKFASILQTITRSTLRKVDMKKVAGAQRNLMKFAKTLLDNGAEFDIQLDEDSSDTILSTIVKHELALLVQHPLIQKELDRKWGPNPTWRGDFTITGYPWVDTNSDEILSWREFFTKNLRSRRLKFLFNFAVYFAFLMLLSFGVLLYNRSLQSNAFYFGDGVKDALFDDFPYIDGVNNFPKVYQDIATIDDFYLWLNGPLLGVLFATPDNRLARYDKILHARVRQFRVQKDSCKVPSYLENITDSCYAAFSAEVEDTTTYPNTTLPSLVFNYTQPTKPTFYSQLSRYYPRDGGFVYEIDMNDPAGTAAYFAALPANDYIDDQTAVVIVEFYAYNPNVNRFLLVRTVTEFANSGKVVPSSYFEAVTLSLYFLKGDKAELVIEIALLVIYLWLVGEELVQMIREKKTYFDDRWNIFDNFIYLFFAACIIIRAIIYVRLKGITFDSAVNQFDEFEGVITLDKRNRDMLAFLLIVAWAGLMKFFRALYDCGILLRIIKRQVYNVENFLLVYVVFLIGFGSAFNVLLGNDVFEFRSWGVSLITMFKLVLGGGDWSPIEESNRWFAIALLVLHSLIAVILLLNLLIAMLNQSYSDVITEATVEHLCERASIILSYGATIGKKTQKIKDLSNRQYNKLRRNDEEEEEKKKKEEEDAKKAEETPADATNPDNIELKIMGADGKTEEPKEEEKKDDPEPEEDKYKRKINKKAGEEFIEYKYAYGDEPLKPGVIKAVDPEKKNIKVYGTKLKEGQPSDFLKDDKTPCITENKEFAWFAVDLGDRVRARPEKVLLRLGCDESVEINPEYFLIQASNLPDAIKDEDPNSSKWDTLTVVIGSYGLRSSYDYNAFDVPKLEKYYRFWRIIQTGMNSQYSKYRKSVEDPEKCYQLALKGFDLYGTFKRKISDEEVKKEMQEEQKEAKDLKAEIAKAADEEKKEKMAEAELENDTLAIVKKLRQEHNQAMELIASLTKIVSAMQTKLEIVDKKVPDVEDFDFVYDDD